MIVLHHLERSRSIRMVWFLEELGAGYEIKPYKRNPETFLAPPELKQAHPLGKAPVVDVDGRTLAESGAIIEYLAETQSGGKLAVPPGHAARADYLYWLHVAEGSAALPLMLHLYTSRLGEAAAPLRPRIDSEIDNQLSFANAALANSDYFVDGRFTAADVQMSFVSDLAEVFDKLAAYPNLVRVRQKHRQRDAYKRAVEKGGTLAAA